MERFVCINMSNNCTMQTSKTERKKKAGDWGKIYISNRKSLQIEKENSNTTLIATCQDRRLLSRGCKQQMLQVLAGQGWTPASWRKEVMEILTPLAPTGTHFQPCIPSSLSLDPTPMDPTSLLSLTHFGSSQPLLEPLHTKYLRDGACVCAHLCICVSMNPMNILLLQSPRPPGFSQNPVLPLE